MALRTAPLPWGLGASCASLSLGIGTEGRGLPFFSPCLRWGSTEMKSVSFQTFETTGIKCFKTGMRMSAGASHQIVVHVCIHTVCSGYLGMVRFHITWQNECKMH